MVMGVVFPAVNEVNGEAGKVTFTGTIVDAPCSLTSDSSQQEVKLGHITQNELKDQGSSKPRPFGIQLENCDITAVGKVVSITFDGSAAGSGTTANLLGIPGVRGAGIAITDANGNRIALGQKTSLLKLVQGDNRLYFSAYLQGLASAAVVPGEFSSIADFVIDYQ